MRKPYLLVSASVALFGVLAGCSGNILPESKKIEYKSAGKLPPLELPPTHLVRLVDDDPGPAKATRLLSRMQEQGYIETAGGPHASDWFMERVFKGLSVGLDMEQAIRHAIARVLGCLSVDVPPALLLMVRSVVENPAGS